MKQKYKSFDKNEIVHELLWSFFKPVIIGWGLAALLFLLFR